MEVHTFFLVLLAARILGELAARLRVPPVIGIILLLFNTRLVHE